MSAAEHTCGISKAGTAFCWGRNWAGQLGIGLPLHDQSVPTAVQTSETFSQLANGFAFSCGLSTRGLVYCWGRNDYGELGNGSIEHRTVPFGVRSP